MDSYESEASQEIIQSFIGATDLDSLPEEAVLEESTSTSTLEQATVKYNELFDAKGTVVLSDDNGNPLVTAFVDRTEKEFSTFSSDEMSVEELSGIAGMYDEIEVTEDSVTVTVSENTVTRNLWATDLTGASLYLVDHSEAHGPDGIVLDEAPELVEFSLPR